LSLVPSTHFIAPHRNFRSRRNGASSPASRGPSVHLDVPTVRITLFAFGWPAARREPLISAATASLTARGKELLTCRKPALVFRPRRTSSPRPICLFLRQPTPSRRLRGIGREMLTTSRCHRRQPCRSSAEFVGPHEQIRGGNYFFGRRKHSTHLVPSGFSPTTLFCWRTLPPAYRRKLCRSLWSRWLNSEQTRC
jgi:hypothetical protein